MPISIFIDPCAQKNVQSAAIPKAQSVEPYPPDGDWHDEARQGNWDLALVGLLREQPRGLVPMFKIVNEVVAESIPGTRSDVRSATTAVLSALTRLRRQGWVIRSNRKWIALRE